MTEFLTTLQQLGCTQAFTVAVVCLGVMASLVIYGIVAMIMEISQC